MIYKYLYRNPEPYLAVIKLLVAKPSGMTREEIREQHSTTHSSARLP